MATAFCVQRVRDDLVNFEDDTEDETATYYIPKNTLQNPQNHLVLGQFHSRIIRPKIYLY